jgi:hypothetical protein
LLLGVMVMSRTTARLAGPVGALVAGVVVLALARSIRRSQSAEITEMEGLLTELGG